MIIDRLFGRIMWFVIMASFAWSIVTMYLIVGYFSTNCGIWLPYWKEMLAMCVKVICYCHGA